MIVNIKVISGANVEIYDENFNVPNEKDAIYQAIVNNGLDVCDEDTIHISVVEY